MTELLFHNDSYLNQFDAQVTEITDDGVVLDRTAFYIGGGGQPNDVGVLIGGSQEYPVTRVGRSDGKIIHRIDGDLPPTGANIVGRIDWMNSPKKFEQRAAPVTPSPSILLTRIRFQQS